MCDVCGLTPFDFRQTVPASGIYPFDTQLADRSKRVEEDNGVLIVDVGGAQGGSMKEVREAHPGLKGRIVVSVSTDGSPCEIAASGLTPLAIDTRSATSHQ